MRYSLTCNCCVLLNGWSGSSSKSSVIFFAASMHSPPFSSHFVLDDSFSDARSVQTTWAYTSSSLVVILPPSSCSCSCFLTFNAGLNSLLTSLSPNPTHTKTSVLQRRNKYIGGCFFHSSFFLFVFFFFFFFFLTFNAVLAGSFDFIITKSNIRKILSFTRNKLHQWSLLLLLPSTS